MRKTTVLVVGIDWPAETFIMRMLWGLVDAGVDVTVASHHRPDAEWLAYTNSHWLSVPHWKGNKLRRLFRVGRQIGRSALLARDDLRRSLSHAYTSGSWTNRLRTHNRLLPLAGYRWDIVYFPWNSAAIEYLPIFDAGSRVVVSCRGSQVNVVPHNPERYIEPGLRETLGRADAVHCVSKDILRQVMKYGVDPSKACLIRPAVDPDVFLPAEREARGRIRIVSTGSLIWRKGYEYALQAIRHIVDEGIPVHYEIIGDGPEKQRATYAIHDLHLQEHVTMSGRLKPKQVVDRLRYADVFLLNSLSEGISNAVLEAMSCTLPVVTTSCGGMQEAVTDGVEGFVVPVRNPRATANALSMLCGSAELRRQMGTAGRQRIIREFNLRDQTRSFVELFTSLAKSST